MLKHSVLFKCNDIIIIHTQEEYSHQFSFCNARNILQLMIKWCKKGLNQGKQSYPYRERAYSFEVLTALNIKIVVFRMWHHVGSGQILTFWRNLLPLCLHLNMILVLTYQTSQHIMSHNHKGHRNCNSFLWRSTEDLCAKNILKAGVH
jgi:hypothetical protein